jgi:NADPH:quinone reductase-like Zn-dependent oxidoreductase/acyl carrier protein
VPADLVFPIADDLDVAGVGIAQLTAYCALHDVARLQAGERVLIHSAASGVGLAAVHWARHVGAEVYATAGSEAKRAWLRSQGIAHVSDSRSTQFVADVRAWTGGEGVDVVLNALAGPLLEASVGLLREGGRFVEIGKRDYLANRPLGLQPFLRGLSLTLLDLAGRIRRDPAAVRQRMQAVLTHVRSGVLPPLPQRAFPLSEAADALWAMARGQHIGKLVLTVAEATPPSIAVAPERRLRADGSYLVTGGLGGLGLSLARWMADEGAGHLVLLGRSGVKTPAVAAAVDAIRAAGARVTVAQADVADAEALAVVLAPLTDLRGVVHAAGVLDDGLLTEQTPERFERVCRPKVAGAQHLDRLTRGAALDFFVLYGSAAALLGSPGQGNYAAANAYLAALAWRRRSDGLPALCLDWGGFAEVGLAAAQATRGARLAARGLRLLTPDEGVRLFARLVGSAFTQVAPCPIDIAAWLDFYPELAGWPYIERLVAAGSAAAGAGDAELLAALAGADDETAARLLTAHVIAETGRVLRLDPARLDGDTPFTALGLDSLMGLELRHRLQATCGVRLPATAVWSFPNPRALGRHLAEFIAGRRLPSALPAPEPVAPAVPASPPATVDQLLTELAELEGLLDG